MRVDRPARLAEWSMLENTDQAALCRLRCRPDAARVTKVVEDGPKVEAEECVRLVGVVKKFLYLEVQGGPFKQAAVLPGQNQRKERNQPRDI
ncbi:hypothetical protein EYF80_010431 [Liparis tanakae]|uniref:Uncharacterized protein n=1 Tax=Liparis tanakae TaxID=230148 RepID=A0A4Z2INP1_9TELE|nr:hypothetical protein EYF80_010431 [Liparis tanakae]